jgi:hypothetical protein
VNDQQDLWAEIIAEMESRRQIGLKTYGVPVTATESVNWLKHAEEEGYDLVVYLRACRLVMEKMQRRLVELETKLTQTERELNKYRLQDQMKQDVASLKRFIEQKVNGGNQ